MRKRPRPPLKSGFDYLLGFMHGLQDDRRRLKDIQSTYDNLTLLGQLLGAGTDITRMRADFNRLADVLIEQMASEHHRKAVLNLGYGARVAIDTLTRNLYERTADIGFLATDAEICSFAQAVANDPSLRQDASRLAALRARFGEYVQNYSVYHNIILLTPDGQVLVQLDEHNPATCTTDPLLEQALRTEAGYVEAFHPTDLLPLEASPLVYAYRVMSDDGRRATGVLCLCFRFQDECQRIFDSLVAEDDWNVITLLDANQRVIASSDSYQFPLGVRLEPVPGEDCRVVRFAGREYLASTRPAQGYQGYTVPGWRGHALAPLNHAFEMSAAHELESVRSELLDCVLASTSLFSPELRAIPRNAARIQSELNRAVWNGHVWLLRLPDAAQSGSFAKVLLHEIGDTGERTRSVFAESIHNLYKTVLSSVLFDCSQQAALAIEIMDRNLYERANDCRWWALTPAFRAALQPDASPSPEQSQRLSAILRHINSLYTVYSNLLLFDQNGQVLALSNPADSDWLGKPLGEPWVRAALALPDSLHYCVSHFVSSPLYGGQPTCIFSAAVRTPSGNEPVGGIAIVFDSAPQFQAMLHDALPRQANGNPVPGAFAVFAERERRVISSTHPGLQAGAHLAIDERFVRLERGESCSDIIIYEGRYFAVGSTMSAGYREYKSDGQVHRNDVVALVFWPLSDGTIDPISLAQLDSETVDAGPRRTSADTDSTDIACFLIGRNWYGVLSSHVIEALDGSQLMPMPGLLGRASGCLMHQDQVISVYDLAADLVAAPAGQERRQAGGPATQRQIVVLQVSGQTQRFGVLVDALGAVRNVANARIDALSDAMTGSTSLVESLVKPEVGSADRRLLLVLSTPRILRRFSK